MTVIGWLGGKGGSHRNGPQAGSVLLRHCRVVAVEDVVAGGREVGEVAARIAVGVVTAVGRAVEDVLVGETVEGGHAARRLRVEGWLGHITGGRLESGGSVVSSAVGHRSQSEDQDDGGHGT